MAATNEFDAQHGIDLMNANRFDEASAYFSGHLLGSAVAHYCLASAKFRKDPRALTPEQLHEIIELFDSAIALDPGFGDAFFMCGIACNTLAGFELGRSSRDPSNLTVGKQKEIEDVLAKGERYLRKAVELVPGFAAIGKEQFERVNELRNFHERLRTSMS